MTTAAPGKSWRLRNFDFVVVRRLSSSSLPPSLSSSSSIFSQLRRPLLINYVPTHDVHRGWLGRFFQPEHFRFMWHRDDEEAEKKVPTFTSLRVEQAPEPSDVYWENLNLTDTSRFLRLAFSNLITFCLLLFSFGIAIIAAGAQQNANAKIASTNFCDELVI